MNNILRLACTIPAPSTLIRFKRNWSCFAPFSNENGTVLLRFQKDLRPHLSFSYCFRPSTLQRSSREKPHGTVCSPFWILTVDWAGAQSCLFRCRHCFQITSFSPFTLENSVFKKHSFQIAPLWRAFSNDHDGHDHFRRCSVDDSRIRSRTAPFSFENGLVWTGPNLSTYVSWKLIWNDVENVANFSFLMNSFSLVKAILNLRSDYFINY